MSQNHEFSENSDTDTRIENNFTVTFLCAPKFLIFFKKKIANLLWEKRFKKEHFIF